MAPLKWSFHGSNHQLSEIPDTYPWRRCSRRSSRATESKGKIQALPALLSCGIPQARRNKGGFSFDGTERNLLNARKRKVSLAAKRQANTPFPVRYGQFWRRTRSCFARSRKRRSATGVSPLGSVQPDGADARGARFLHHRRPESYRLSDDGERTSGLDGALSSDAPH